MNRNARVLVSAALAAVGVVSTNAAASAATTFDTGMVTVVAATRAVRVGIGGIAVVSVDKVSNPGVQVRVTAEEGSEPGVSTTHAPGENGCSAADNPGGGTLNRTVSVNGGPSTTATVYVKVQYTTTTPIGLSTTTVLEPLGPSGSTVAAADLNGGVPVSVCVA